MAVLKNNTKRKERGITLSPIINHI